VWSEELRGPSPGRQKTHRNQKAGGWWGGSISPFLCAMPSATQRLAFRGRKWKFEEKNVQSVSGECMKVIRQVSDRQRGRQSGARGLRGMVKKSINWESRVRDLARRPHPSRQKSSESSVAKRSFPTKRTFVLGGGLG